ncbi:MAG: hypothetical protein DWC02_06755 [Candidatus Poseidoniales archaeon]|nr:MAG: hypothetical protein DWC02_06755 [Candidatus Poseidoniales archaeon]
MDSCFMKVIIKGDSMWPTYNDGESIDCTEYNGSEILESAIVVFAHPLKTGVICVKRVARVNDESIFVQGDNPDPTASEDSHNFGWVKKASIIAIKHG